MSNLNDTHLESECRPQSDCLHEQVAKVDCERLIYFVLSFILMLGSKDAIRIVPYFVLPQFYPIFAYREADAPLLCSYRGGSLSHKTTPVQAHRGFRILTLTSHVTDIIKLKSEKSNENVITDLERAGIVE